MGPPNEVSDPDIIDLDILVSIKVNLNFLVARSPTVSDLDNIVSTAEFAKHCMSLPFIIFGPWKNIRQYIPHVCAKNMSVLVRILDNLESKCKHMTLCIHSLSSDTIPSRNSSSFSSKLWMSIDQCCYQAFSTQMNFIFGPPKNLSLDCFCQSMPHTSTGLTLIAVERIIKVKHWLKA